MVRAGFRALLSLLLAVIVVGCRHREGDFFGTTQPQHGTDEVWINNSTEPEWIDPGKCSDSAGGEVIWNIFAGLTDTAPETEQPVPDLA
ncbi:MAG: hypothetical protein KDA99_26495, partial [Planctomycetales bacterium]|nr:hypothetical protein [Planctomycetales bacterium]